MSHRGSLSPRVKRAASLSHRKRQRGGRRRKLVGDFQEEFLVLLDKAKQRVAQAQKSTYEKEVLDSAKNLFCDMSEEILETSGFTICVRIRPIIAQDSSAGPGDNLKAIIPGLDSLNTNKNFRGRVDNRVNRVNLLTPKFNTRGEPTLDRKVMKFDYVWGDTSNDNDIYRDIGVRMVNNVLAGRMDCCFAYGQTGSGKTYTMMGLMNSMSNALFAKVSTGQYRITFSFFEILGVTCTDCLSSLSGGTMQKGSKNSKGVIIGEDLTGAIVTRNLSEHNIKSVDDFRRIVEIAASHRATRSTKRNSTSSRSHAIATITVHRADFPTDAAPAPGVLRIIDLAGSERASDSNTHDKETMKETKLINQSLMTLKECIRARTKASKSGAASDTQCRVPYRKDKLTLLMKDIFDIGCRRICSTTVVACVSPLSRDVAHSANTLSYAAPLRVAVGKQTTNIQVDPDDPSYWNHSNCQVSGVQLIRMPEAVFISRCIDGNTSEESINVAKILYGKLWTLQVDAKTRKRRPDGSIITAADLEAEAQRNKAILLEKQKIWDERNAAMDAARRVEENNWVEGTPVSGPIQHIVQERWSRGGL